jgi:hypothetical protein
MMELKMTPRKRSAEAVDPVLSAKRRLISSDSSNIVNNGDSSRVTRVHFSTEQNSEQTAATDVYQGLSEEECRELRSQIWYTVSTVDSIYNRRYIVLTIKHAIAVLMNE